VVKDNGAYCSHRVLDADEYIDLTHYGTKWERMIRDKGNAMMDQCPKCGEWLLDSRKDLKCLALYCDYKLGGEMSEKH
jgi:hypothetical protein